MRDFPIYARSGATQRAQRRHRDHREDTEGQRVREFSSDDGILAYVVKTG
jgi:hypothetical protein